MSNKKSKRKEIKREIENILKEEGRFMTVSELRKKMGWRYKPQTIGLNCSYDEKIMSEKRVRKSVLYALKETK